MSWTNKNGERIYSEEELHKINVRLRVDELRKKLKICEGGVNKGAFLERLDREENGSPMPEEVRGSKREENYKKSMNSRKRILKSSPIVTDVERPIVELTVEERITLSVGERTPVIDKIIKQNTQLPTQERKERTVKCRKTWVIPEHILDIGGEFMPDEEIPF